MGTIAEDQKRAEVLAVPLVAVVLFFVFGGVVAASAAMVGAVHRRLTGHHALGRDIRAGALFRAAGGDADRSGHRHRLQALRGHAASGRRSLRATTPKPRYAAP